MKVEYSTKFRIGYMSKSPIKGYSVVRVTVCAIAKHMEHSKREDLLDFIKNEPMDSLFDLARKSADSMGFDQRIAVVEEKSTGGEKFYKESDVYGNTVYLYDSVSAIISFTSKI